MVLNIVNFVKSNLLFFKSRISSSLVIVDFLFFFILLDILLNYNFLSVAYSLVFSIFNYIILLSNFNFILLLVLIILRSVILNKIFYKNQTNYSNYNKYSNYNSIYLWILYNLNVNNFFFVNLNFLISYVWNVLYLIFSKSYLIQFIISEVSLFTTQINWYPIFKRHSIFGYYRISRQNWVELKTEEVNYIKY